jgi:transcriptional regulator with XRE-family HTH domain
MTNRADTPSKEQVIEARERAGINQTEAAKLVHLSSFTRWSEYERGERNIDSARFELFQIKTGQHPDYAPKKRPSPKSVLRQENHARNV